MSASTPMARRLTCNAVPAQRPVPSLLEDARAGLLSVPRSLPPKYFYDDVGSHLFEDICATPEYYPSRTEGALLAEHAQAIMATARPAQLLELGSGSSRKTRHLLDAWNFGATQRNYWPLDVCEQIMLESGERLINDYPGLSVHALVGDYNGGLAGLPLPREGRRLVVFLGGTIGNFDAGEARVILKEIAALMAPEDYLLLGADRVKDPAVLRAAYDDARGMTARFNKNLLHVLNRELDADFPVAGYRHRALYNSEHARIEMRLSAAADHRVRLGRLDTHIDVLAGEDILTEISRKFTRASLRHLLSVAGLREAAHFEAPGGAYSLVLAARA